MLTIKIENKITLVAQAELVISSTVQTRRQAVPAAGPSTFVAVRYQSITYNELEKLRNKVANANQVQMELFEITEIKNTANK